MFKPGQKVVRVEPKGSSTLVKGQMPFSPLCAKDRVCSAGPDASHHPGCPVARRQRRASRRHTRAIVKRWGATELCCKQPAALTRRPERQARKFARRARHWASVRRWKRAGVTLSAMRRSAPTER